MGELNDDNCRRCICGGYVVAQMVEADFLDNQKIPTFKCSCGEVFYNQTQSDLIDYIRRLHQQLADKDTELSNAMSSVDTMVLACSAKDKEIERLTVLLKPFADGYERAAFKCSWASSYTHADAYKNAYNGLRE